MPFLMQIVNTQIDQIFGPTNSFFVETTPKKFLFEGIEFCKSPIGIASVVCSSVEERNSPSIVKSADGSALKFSMFHHVIYKLLFVKIFASTDFFYRKTQRMTACTKSTLESDG